MSRITAAAMIAMLLAGCGSAPATKDDLQEATSRMESSNYRGDSELRGRVDALEREVAYLRNQNAERAKGVATNAKNIANSFESADRMDDRLFANDEVLRQAINQQRAAAGWDQLPKGD